MSKIQSSQGIGGLGAVNVLMIGSGEYTTGYVNGQASDSDKGAGVVALTMLDMKLQGKTDRLAICGVNGKKFPGIRAHMHSAIGRYAGLDPLIDTVETFPKDTEVNAKAYEDAIGRFAPGLGILTPMIHISILLEGYTRRTSCAGHQTCCQDTARSLNFV